ncbi:DUF1453 domain-containing protein [Saccharopolyspora rosea]|uniref:DUF1453 domain-containing protein n=1 Tax=Saccharopolyspora rosea TaxID=524884 RepID=A0ABW3FR19_9PSEU|nr:DUF1453 domain-containing protein [Saccharopolyspora rosea]
MSTATVVLAVGVVVVAVVRRLRGVGLVADDLFGGPVVLVGIGLYQLVRAAPVLGVVDAVWLAGSLLLGLVAGGLRGATVRLLSRGGALVQRYTAVTLAVWAASFVVSAGFAAVAQAGGMHAQARPMVLSIGIGMLGETAVLGVRALSTGLPFSPGTRRGSASWVDRFVHAARTARPVTPPPNGRLERSPGVRDGLAWLTGCSRRPR